MPDSHIRASLALLRAISHLAFDNEGIDVLGGVHTVFFKKSFINGEVPFC